MATYTAPPPFQPKEEKWEDYMNRFECSLQAAELGDIADERKRAFFLTHCGSTVYSVAKALVAPTSVMTASWATLQTALRRHYSPAPSKYVHRIKFRDRFQREGETINEFVAALRADAIPAEFGSLDEALIEQVIRGVSDMRLQRRLLARQDLTLAAVLDEARAHESSSSATTALHRPRPTQGTSRATTVHQEEASLDESESSGEDVCATEGGIPERSSRSCGSCGGPHPRYQCKFRDAICRHCDKRGHIARVCRTRYTESRAEHPVSRADKAERKFPPKEMAAKRANQRRHSNGGAKFERTEAHTLTIDHASSSHGGKIYTTVQIEGRDCRMEVDSGSHISLVSWEWVKQAFPQLRLRDLDPQNLRIRDCQKRTLPVAGKKDVSVKYGPNTATLPLTIVHGPFPSLLGVDWFPALGLGITGVHSIGGQPDDGVTGVRDDLLREYKDVFDAGLGRYVGTPISFGLNPDVAPIRLKPRRVPLALKPRVEKELDKLVAQGILVPVDHAKWETPIVTPVKPDGSVRICADYKCTINKALQPSAYPVPVIHHLLHTLGGGARFLPNWTWPRHTSNCRWTKPPQKHRLS